MTGKQQLGERIKAARADKGWKQKQLATQMDVEPITISRWERGATAPDLDVLRLVARVTEKPLGYFIAESLPPAPDLPRRVERLEESLGRVEQKLDALLERLAG